MMREKFRYIGWGNRVENHSRWRFGHPCSHVVSYKDTGLQGLQPHNLGDIGSSLFYWLTGSGGAQTKPLKLFLLQKIIGSFLKAVRKRHLARTWATRLIYPPAASSKVLHLY